MNNPWIIGLLLAIVFFAFFEWWAFKYPQRQNTLSRWIYDMGQTWPLSIWLMGMFAGGLAVHFFWHWCPAGSISTGWLIEQMRDFPVTQANCIAILTNPATFKCD